MPTDNRFIIERKRIKSVFNFASPIYPLIELSLIPQYHQALERLSLPSDLSVLDVATGTGILAAEFHRRGHIVRGIDFSPKLLKRARKKYPQIDFNLMDLLDVDIANTKKADIISAGYLLHGLSQELRKIILQKAATLANKYVVIFDHSNQTNWIIKLIEYLEGSYYQEFITSDKYELFNAAGLEIKEEFLVDKFGYCWLCGKTNINSGA